MNVARTTPILSMLPARQVRLVLLGLAVWVAGAAEPSAGGPPVGSTTKSPLIEFAGVARCEAAAGWRLQKDESAADPFLRLAEDPYVIRVRLLGGKGSRYATMDDFLSGFEATTMGRPPEKLRIIKVAGVETWLYRHGYPIMLGDPHVSDPTAVRLAEEEFCLLPTGTRFIVLCWAREDLPDPMGRGEAIWRSFLDSFELVD